MKIRIGIVGYGNLGRGVECAIRQNPDMELAAVFTRRPPESLEILTTGVPVYSMEAASSMKDEIDVMILCGGSATDLPVQTPEFARLFNVVDSFDTHAEIPRHFAAADQASRQGGKVSVVAVGWDPGLFSLNRVYAGTVLPVGTDYTFWGRGVSQGHSDAIRRIPGVKDARQYTIPVEEALQAVRQGETPAFTTRQMHLRECFVVLEAGADPEAVREAIVTMPNYFADYDTAVHFISLEELREAHGGIPHGGFVIRSGRTGWEEDTRQIVEYRLNLESNPEFTASVMVAYGRAAFRMNREGQSGCRTVFDIPLSAMSPESPEELRRKYL